ncbi:hypothetical protein V8017_18265 [Stenotrophomonas rhizophila]
MTATVSRARPLALLTALLLASGQACVVASAADNDVLIRNAMVFDATGRAPYAASVLVQDGRIAAIGADLKAPAHTRRWMRGARRCCRACSTCTPTGPRTPSRRRCRRSPTATWLRA